MLADAVDTEVGKGNWLGASGAGTPAVALGILCRRALADQTWGLPPTVARGCQLLPWKFRCAVFQPGVSGQSDLSHGPGCPQGEHSQGARWKLLDLLWPRLRSQCHFYVKSKVTKLPRFKGRGGDPHLLLGEVAKNFRTCFETAASGVVSGKKRAHYIITSKK